MRPLTEFAEERDVKPNTISAYISRYKDVFEGHTMMDGKRMMLDDHAMAILAEQYPVPEKVKVVPDYETMKALANAQAEVIRLQQQIIANAEIIAKAQTTMLLIGVKDEKIESQQQEIFELQQKQVELENQYKPAGGLFSLFGLYKKTESSINQPNTPACDAGVDTNKEE